MRNRNLTLALAAAMACALIAAGCGGDETTTSADPAGQIEDVQVPQDAQDAIDQAQDAIDQAPEDLPDSIDEAVQQCIDNVDSSNLPDDQKQSLKDLCQSSGDAAKGGVEDAQK